MNPLAAMKLARSVGGCLLTGRPKPLAAFLYLSFKCNLLCTYCNLPHLRNHELKTDQWLTIIDQLADLGCRRINFIGGEPLLRPDLGELLARAKERGIARVVSTNGLEVPAKLDTLRLASSICVSLDGPDQESNLTRGPQVWQGVQKAVEAATSIGLPIKINTVVSTQNLPNLPGLIELVTGRWKTGITISAVRSGNPELYKNAEDVRLDNQQMRALFGKLAEMARRNPRILYSRHTYQCSSSWPDYSRDYLEEADQKGTVAGPACQAGRYYLCILPDGRAAPCTIRFDYQSTRDVATHGVEATWRELHNHNCQSCYSPCMVELNHLFSFKPGVLVNFARRHVPRLS